MAENTALKIFAQKLRNSKQFIANKVVDIVAPTYKGTKIVVLNKVQMSKGEDSEENQLGNYSEGWGEYRESKGKQIDFIDLQFTNKFAESIYTEGVLLSASKAALKINAKGQRWEDLQEDERFKKALGLNQDNRDKVGMMIALEVQKELLKYYMP